MRAVVSLLAGLTLALAPVALGARASTPLPTPASMLGFEPCADYKLATYEAIDAYLSALDAASDLQHKHRLDKLDQLIAFFRHHKLAVELRNRDWLSERYRNETL